MFGRTVIGFFLFSLACGLGGQQVLANARLDVSGKLATPGGPSVTLVVTLPGDYGLTPRERSEEWPPLNKTSERTVTLHDSGFQLSFPSLLYCTHTWVWQSELPAPPAWLILRFSDAPDEEYHVWSRGRSVAYVVVDMQGVKKPNDEALWGLQIGALSRTGTNRDATWLLKLEITRQRPARAGTEGPGERSASPRSRTGRRLRAA